MELSVHQVNKIKLEEDSHNGTHWIRIAISSEEGEVEVTCFQRTNSKIEVEVVRE